MTLGKRQSLKQKGIVPTLLQIPPNNFKLQSNKQTAIQIIRKETKMNSTRIVTVELAEKAFGKVSMLEPIFGGKKKEKKEKKEKKREKPEQLARGLVPLHRKIGSEPLST